jgi:hypothetical protein
MLALALAACGNEPYRYDAPRGDDESGPQQIVPVDYKPDLLAYLRVYLNEPTGVRDAFVSEPVSRQILKRTRYVVCLRFNARKTDGTYVGDREYLAIYSRGRFDQLVDRVGDNCAGVTYTPFHELESLTR